MAARRSALVTLLLLGCQQPTQLIVQVDSDLEPGVEIVAVDVTVGPDGEFGASHSFELESTPLPFSFGVAPRNANDEAVRVAVAGIGADGDSLVRFVAVTRFVPGSVRLLNAPLSRACVGNELVCDEMEMICLDGACAPIEVPPEALHETSPDAAPMRLFDGPRVAPDAGSPPGADAGSCVPDAPCMTGNPCELATMDCAAEIPSCTSHGLAPEGTECGEGRSCDAEGTCGAQH
jgi:hypothetical protein